MTPDANHFATVGVIGAGAWGTALAVQLARNGYHVRLWGNVPEHQSKLITERTNQRFLPGIDFPDTLQAVAELPQCVDADDVLVVVPSQAFRPVVEEIKPHLRPASRLAWATKGLEPGTASLLPDVAMSILGQERQLAVISGPTFAMEVAKGLPTAMTVASSDESFAHDLARALHNETCRVYLSDDVVGVSLGGAMKNVYAIAAGIADGLGYGANTRAALLTRALAEMRRLGLIAGGQGETFMGLTGLGDLILTCTDDQSRNRRFGLALARGLSVEQARASIDQVVEGIGTAREVMQLASRLNVEVPICQQVCRVLFDGLPAREAVQILLARESLQAELE